MNYLYNGCKGVKIKETIHDTYAGTELKGGSKVCTQHNFSWDFLVTLQLHLLEIIIFLACHTGGIPVDGSK